MYIIKNIIKIKKNVQYHDDEENEKDDDGEKKQKKWQR